MVTLQLMTSGDYDINAHAEGERGLLIYVVLHYNSYQWRLVSLCNGGAPIAIIIN